MSLYSVYFCVFQGTSRSHGWMTPRHLWLSSKKMKWIWVSTGAKFTNVFSVAIQIQWNLRFTLTSIQTQQLLQNFVQETIAVLSWHMKKFVAIQWPLIELLQGKVSIKVELQAKKLTEKGPLVADHRVSTGTCSTINIFIEFLIWCKSLLFWSQKILHIYQDSCRGLRKILCVAWY